MANATYRGRIIVNDTDYTGSFVDPNPSGVVTDDLNTVGIDGKIFNIAGGGGSSVIPNPSGTPTDTLTKLGINGTVYGIQGGGGGFSITDLCTVGAQDIGTLTLNDSILNYDVIIVECCRDTSFVQRGNIWLPVAIIDQSSPYRRYRCVCPTGSSGQDASYDFYFQNNNQIVKSYSFGSFLYSVRGVKFS